MNVVSPIALAMVLGQTPPKDVNGALAQIRQSLGDPVAIGDYRIQPPRGAKLIRTPSADGTVTYTFRGAKPKEGRAPELTVFVGKPPAALRKATATQILASLMSAIRQRRSHWSESRPKKVTLGGIPFVRLKWQGRDLDNNKHWAGFQYVARDRDRMIQIWSHDVMPTGIENLVVSDVAAQTFLRK